MFRRGYIVLLLLAVAMATSLTAMGPQGLVRQGVARAAEAQSAGPTIRRWKPVPYRHLPVNRVSSRRRAGRGDLAVARQSGLYARKHARRDKGPKGAHLPGLSPATKRATSAPAPSAATVQAAGAPASNGKVLILDSTVTGGEGSIEAQAAIAAGFGVDVVDAATWSAMTADQFAAYRAIILGDPTCSVGGSAIAAAEANALTWGPVVNGNIEIVGTDPVYHAKSLVTQRGVEFAVGQAGKTGAYITLSCYFHGAAPQTHVSLLDGLDVGGSGFSVAGVGCFDNIHIVATSPALRDIDDPYLSGWGCSVHEAFDGWPAKFGVLAIDTDAGSLYTAQDGTTGNPYILAYPGGAFQGVTETAGGGSRTGHNNQCQSGDNPINCATGEFWHTFSDLSVPGRGPALNPTRTYSSTRAAMDSPFGHGWSSPYTMSLAVDSASGAVQVTQENGSTTVFTPTSGGYAAAPRVYATLTKHSDGSWSFIRHQQERFSFDPQGRLTAIADRNGYTTTLSYGASDQLTTVTDPTGRTLTFAYGSNGKISKVTDPAGRSVAYRYDTANHLVGTTDVAGGEWTFTYDAVHLLMAMTNPRGGTITNVYDATGKVTKQTDPAGRATTYAYDGAGGTTITSPDGRVTVQQYTQGQLVSLTRGAGTPSEATWRYAYDGATLGLTKSTDPNGHTTTYAYEGGSYQPTSVTDPLGRITKTTYNSFEQPLTVTDPAGTTTTYTYDTAGNPTSSSRPLAAGGDAATTTYEYGDPAHPGDVTRLTDPTGNAWTYTYDASGDLTSSTNPAGDKTTYSYDGIGRRTSMVSPRGNASGADPTSFTTTYTYDAFGDLTKTVDPLGHTSSYSYDPNRNRTSVTDANGHVTSYSYNAADELTKVTRADGTSLTVSYDADGNQTGQTDAAGRTTSYTYDPLDRVASTTDPLGRTTTHSYDPAGNRTRLTDPSGNTTSYTFDAANQLTEITHSDGTTPNVTFAYDADGQRTTMTDGTGTSHYTYDSLNRLTSSTNGAGATVAYNYDLAGRLTSLTYPNGKTVTRDYDAVGRLSAVADWLGNTTEFSHDPNGNLTTQAYPNGVHAVSSYDNADRLTSIVDRTATATLASFGYTRDDLGQLTSTDPTGVPGGPESYSYTDLNQLASLNGKAYEYDHADNLVRLANGTTQTFDAANQLQAVTPSAGGGATAPVVDQVVSADQTRRSSRLTAPPITTAAGERLLLAFVAADGPKWRRQSVRRVTGGGLRWSLAARANRRRGTAEVWQAHADQPLAAVTITATLRHTGRRHRHGGYRGSITVAAFSGAASAVGATATGGGRRGAPSVRVTTTKDNALVWAAGHDLDRARARTPNTGQTLVHQFLDTRARDTYWVQRTDAVTHAGTTVDVGTSAPTNDRWQLGGCPEVRGI